MLRENSKEVRMKEYAHKIYQLPSGLREVFELMLREFNFELKRGNFKLKEEYRDEITGVFNGRSIRYWLYDIYESDKSNFYKLAAKFQEHYKKFDKAPDVKDFLIASNLNFIHEVFGTSSKDVTI